MSALTIGNSEGFRVTINEIGARVESILDATGRAWLADTGRSLASGDPQLAFVDGTRGGWDECLPSVSASQHPETGAPIQDHGDFWARNWSLTRVSDSEIRAESIDDSHPLRFVKTCSIAPVESQLDMRYLVTNVSDRDYSFIYSAHPLWAWPESAELSIPGGKLVRTAFGPEWPHPLAGEWPLLAGDASAAPVDLSRLTLDGEITNYKFFVRWAGEVTMTFAASRRRITLTQPDGFCPWLGVCVNRRAWPDTNNSEAWIALEPTTSPTDDLREAAANSTDVSLSPGGSFSWTTRIAIANY
jgi:galactose mutarotase-like enzyme